MVNGMMRELRTPRLLLVLLVAVVFAFLPTGAHAQSTFDDDDDVLIRINGDARVQAGERVDTLVVINAAGFVEGTVKNVVMIHGTLTINGTVENDVTVIDGDLILEDDARVDSIALFSSEMQRSPGATVTGDIEERDEFWAFSGTALALFSVWIWLASTIALIVGALVFAAVGGRQLRGAATAMTSQLPNSIVGGVFLWIALPIVAFLLLFTVVGALLSLTVMVFVLPVMWVLGYIVAGARLGLAVTGKLGREDTGKPLLAAALGVLILQLLVIIPVVGWVIAAIAGLWGAGALAYYAFAAAGGRSFEGPASTTGTEAAPA
jgi:hypothetical protein